MTEQVKEENKSAIHQTEATETLNIDVELQNQQENIDLSDYEKAHANATDSLNTNLYGKSFVSDLNKIEKKYKSALKDSLLDTPSYDEEKSHVRAAALTGGLKGRNYKDRILSEMEAEKTEQKEEKEKSKKSDSKVDGSKPVPEQPGEGSGLGAGIGSKVAGTIGGGLGVIGSGVTSIFSKKRNRKNTSASDADLGKGNVVTHEIITNNQKMRLMTNRLNQKNALAVATHQNMMEKLNSKDINFDWEKGLRDLKSGTPSTEMAELTKNTEVMNAIKEHDIALAALAKEVSPENISEAQRLKRKGAVSEDLASSYDGAIQSATENLEKTDPSMFDMISDNFMEHFENLINSLKSIFGMHSGSSSSYSMGR